MRKLILTVAFLLIATQSYGQLTEIEVKKDYWVYVAIKDKSGVTADDDKGLHKRGDVIQAIPVKDKNHLPTQTEQKHFMIFKTALTKEEVNTLTQEWEGDKILDGLEKRNIIAYRKNKLNIANLEISVKNGVTLDKVDSDKIISSTKTIDDLTRYEVKRLFYAYVQRPIKVVMNKAIPYAHAETVTKLCAVGDNCTDEDYNTFTAWEAAVDGDLVTDTRQETLECYDDDGTLSDSVYIDGSSTSTDYYLKITAPIGERHDGTEDSGFHVISDGNHIINNDDNNTVIEWLEISDATYNDYTVYMDKSGIVRNCLIHDMNNYPGIYTDNSTYIYNNIIYNHSGSGTQANGIASYNTSSNYWYNNTVWGVSNKGFTIGVGYGGTITNNISIGNGTDFDFQNATHSYNVSEDATANGTGSSVDGTDSYFVSVTGGSEDFHLSADATDAIDSGSDLGATYAVDIDGRDRDSEGDTWDIGADELVSAVSAGLSQLIMNVF